MPLLRLDHETSAFEFELRQRPAFSIETGALAPTVRHTTDREGHTVRISPK